MGDSFLITVSFCRISSVKVAASALLVADAVTTLTVGSTSRRTTSDPFPTFPGSFLAHDPQPIAVISNGNNRFLLFIVVWLFGQFQWTPPRIPLSPRSFRRAVRIGDILLHPFAHVSPAVAAPPAVVQVRLQIVTNLSFPGKMDSVLRFPQHDIAVGTHPLAAWIA